MATRRIKINNESYTGIAGVNDANFVVVDGAGKVKVHFGLAEPANHTRRFAQVYEDDIIKGNATQTMYIKASSDQADQYVTVLY